VTHAQGIDRSLLLEDRSSRRLLLTQLHQDTCGSEWFVLACAVKSVLYDGRYLGSMRTRHQSLRAEPFLRRWQSAMNHWASRNCDVLRYSLSCHSRDSDLAPGWSPISEHVLATPASPARPTLPVPVLRRLGTSALRLIPAAPGEPPTGASPAPLVQGSQAGRSVLRSVESCRSSMRTNE
jgi:hypothetical protein